MKEKKIDIKFKENAHLVLWKMYLDDEQKGKNIFLTHGTFSNRKVCMAVSEYLVKKGYTCWILEWRNHGASSTISGAYNFEIIGKEDIQCAFEYLFEEEKLTSIDCVTHSGGGISLTINLIENPENIQRINRMVFFGCQAFGAGYSIGNRFKLRAGNYISRLLGYIPAKKIGRPHNETYTFMKQWLDWNISSQFLSEAGKDYKIEMPRIRIPILSISGEGDKFVAPMSGCKTYLSCFKNPINQLLHCSKETGFSEDYDHSRLIYSRNAEKEIYPKVLEWIER
jgi:predicted alpha/beta hydrolase